MYSIALYKYKMEGDLIHIKMHHGGSFSMEGPLTYDGGEVSIFRDCDDERTSYFCLVRMAKDVDFKDGDELYYTVPGCSLDERIDLIHDDNSVIKMLNFAKNTTLQTSILNIKTRKICLLIQDLVCALMRNFQLRYFT